MLSIYLFYYLFFTEEKLKL